MLRPLYTLQLPSSALRKLQDACFLYFEDILSSEASKNEANAALRDWGSDLYSWENVLNFPSSTTALDVWQAECSCRNIITFCEAVDEILNGGIPLRMITELCGAPGTGKTQFCLQLCVSVQVPKELGGVGGEALYIDTDGGFSIQRLKEIAESCCHYCQTLKSGNTKKESLTNFNVEQVLNGVHYIEINNYTEILATVSSLETYLSSNDKVRLIVIDNLPFTFRYGATTFQNRTRFMYRLMLDLQSLSSKFNIAVIVTNHLTTYLEFSSEDGNVSKSSLVSSLGDSFAHLVGNRLMLGCAPPSVASIFIEETPHLLMITKSSVIPEASTMFQIEDGGIRDVT